MIAKYGTVTVTTEGISIANFEFDGGHPSFDAKHPYNQAIIWASTQLLEFLAQDSAPMHEQLTFDTEGSP